MHQKTDSVIPSSPPPIFEVSRDLSLSSATYMKVLIKLMNYNALMRV